jgi:hypothetical protein
MGRFSVRLRLFLLLMLVVSTFSLNKTKACNTQHCAELYNRNGDLKGYGCAIGGDFIECYARTSGCTIIYCAE